MKQTSPPAPSKSRPIRLSVRVLIGLITVLALFGAMLNTAVAQQSTASAPIGDVTNGIIIYQQRCANCHGMAGLGDGPIAAQALSPPTPLGDPTYQRGALPTTMFETITTGRLQRGMPLFGEGSSNPLTEQERWDVIAAIYALGSSAAELDATGQQIDETLAQRLQTVDWTNSNNRAVFDSLADTELDEDGRWAVVNWGRMAFGAEYYLGPGAISGNVLNVTTGVPLAEGRVTLVAFEELEIVQSWEAELNSEGAFNFDLPSVPADWVFRLTMAYQSLPYSSDFVLLTADEMSQSETILVYDRTNSTDSVAMQELRVVAEVAQEIVYFNEFYAYRNDGNMTYTGGMQLFVPDSAEDLLFLGITPNGEFFPLEGINQAGDGYFYAEPIVPGAGLELVVRYRLPYDGGVTIEHAVSAQPEITSLFVPEELNVAGMWQASQAESLQGVSYTRYNTTLDNNLLSVSIGGDLRFVIDANGERQIVRNESQELLIGGVALAITVAACAYLLNLWQQQSHQDPTLLLQEIASLDDAYAAKQIKKKPYEKRRKQLLQQVRDMWG